MRTKRLKHALVLLVGLVFVAAVRSALAGSDDTDPTAKPELSKIFRELQQLKADRDRSNRQIKQIELERAHDEKVIDTLETQVQEIQGQNKQLVKTNEQLQGQTQALQAKVASVPTSSQFAQAVESYSGTHQFVVTGSAAGDFIYDRKTNTNTFALGVEPIILYRMNDWLAFEASIEGAFDAGGPGAIGSGASFDMPVATAQLFLNDYAELMGGVFDQPFGDFYEDQGPSWVNRMITAPLPFGSEALITPTDLGLQLRGGLQWGALGQDLDYTAWVSNGPSFTLFPQAVVGNAVNGVNNITINTHGKAFGGRIRIYPLPVDSKLGRLELGASTYDGKYQDGMWLNSWGVDFAYHRGNLQARGEYLETYRQMGSEGFPANTADNRQGWYVQAGYFLTGLHPSFLGPTLSEYFSRLEPIVRYSGVNQRGIVVDDTSNIPALGANGSPSIFSPHAREVALGLDYWIAPSIVWQTELDLELPRAGGLMRNDTIKLTRPVSQLRLPPTVLGILAARIDRQSSEHKQLLQTLAVIGRESPLRLIRRITHANPRLEEMLAHLQASEFIYEQTAAIDIEYVFKHALTQEVAYNSLLIERRKQLHEQTGQALELIFTEQLEDHLVELAHHYSHSDNIDKAVEYMGRAGRQAMQRSAYADAIGTIGIAIDLLQKLPHSRERLEKNSLCNSRSVCS